MQDLVGGDYFRTPAKFQGSDIFVFVGNIKGFDWHLEISHFLILCYLV